MTFLGVLVFHSLVAVTGLSFGCQASIRLRSVFLLNSTLSLVYFFDNLPKGARCCLVWADRFADIDSSDGSGHLELAIWFQLSRSRGFHSLFCNQDFACSFDR